MFQLYEKFKWAYRKFKLEYFSPILLLVLYTLFGAFVFKSLEEERDERNREEYRNRTDYALRQVLERMLEVRCHDQLIKASRDLQVQHTKQALFWFLDHLNLTEVISERTDPSPWTWLGSMFYAGQLYTTIGYGYPITRTIGGRIASIIYILIGIPVFLLILKEFGRQLSRLLKKLYRRLHSSKTKIVAATPLKAISFPNLGLTKEKNGKIDISHTEKGGFDPKQPQLVIDAVKPEESQDEKDEFPIWIALAILFLWIMISSILFTVWEDHWPLETSVYFFLVSISTVGLGDILFHNPDRMIVYFILILVGLSLLSMCFNLIQTAIERFLDKLLEKYIEEIEKMAEIVANDEYLEEETMPLEFKMTGNLLTLPMKRVQQESGFFAEAKGWMAERIANNLLASRLGPVEHEDSDAEDSEKMPEPNGTGPGSMRPSRKNSHTSTTSRHSGSNRHLYNYGRYQFRHNKPLFNTIKTLEKIKPQQGDFKSMIFSKFINSERLTKLVEETAVPQAHMVTSGCQTDFVEEARPGKLMKRRKDSYSSFSGHSLLDDSVSLASAAAYCDMKFDFASEAPTPTDGRPMKSTLSILKLDDDEPLLPSKLEPGPIWQKIGVHTPSPWRPAVRVNPSLSAVREMPSPGVHSISPRRCPSDNNLRDNRSDNTSDEAEGYGRIRTICGLLPNDFDEHSISSRSTMLDSGYERSQAEDSRRPTAFSPELSRLDDSITEDSSLLDSKRPLEDIRILIPNSKELQLEMELDRDEEFV